MVLKIYGTYRSPPTCLVVFIAREKGVPFEFIFINMPNGEHKHPAFLEKQPFGQVPYIVSGTFCHLLHVCLVPVTEAYVDGADTNTQDDDGFLLYESRAIVRYIATKYASHGPDLIPKDLEAAAQFEQAASIEQNNFVPSTWQIFTERVIKPYVSKPRT
jgi:glutathione S-transferase